MNKKGGLNRFLKLKRNQKNQDANCEELGYS